MARPIKEGLDYFPHDVDALTDEKLESLILLHGAEGYFFYFGMLERIYRTPLGEIDISATETRQILSQKLRMTLEKYESLVLISVNLGLFSANEYKTRGVLTSQGIKRRRAIVLQKRENSRNMYRSKVSDAETPQETIPETPQVKKRKEKEIDKEKGEDESSPQKKDRAERISEEKVREIFRAYPKERRVAYEKVKPKIKDAIRAIGFDKLLFIVKSYTESRQGKDHTFTPMITKWFNERRYENSDSWTVGGNTDGQNRSYGSTGKKQPRNESEIQERIKHNLSLLLPDD